MDFSNIKAITIPEGNVKKITSNGVVLWKGGYTNLVDTATTTPGGTEIYGGVGYKNGWRWSSSSKADKNDSAYGRATGWMLYKQGLLRIKNFGVDRDDYGYAGYAVGGYLALHKTNGTYQTIELGWTTLEGDYNEITLNYAGVDYFKISGYCTRNYQDTPLLDPPIVTIDEEIT